MPDTVLMMSGLREQNEPGLKFFITLPLAQSFVAEITRIFSGKDFRFFFFFLNLSFLMVEHPSGSLSPRMLKCLLGLGL